jgi:hypothetical protein
VRISEGFKAAIGGALLLGTLITGQTWESKSRPTPVGNPFTTYKSFMRNCEDIDVQPCYTFDEGKWRIVYSYNPYKSRAVSLCNSKSSNLPCLTKSTNSDGAKVYKWRGSL